MYVYCIAMCGTMKQYIACKIHHHVHHTSNLFFPQTHISLQAYPTLLPFFHHPWQGHPPPKMILMQLAPHLLMHAIVQWFPCHCLQMFILGKFNLRHICYCNIIRFLLAQQNTHPMLVCSQSMVIIGCWFKDWFMFYQCNPLIHGLHN